MYDFIVMGITSSHIKVAAQQSKTHLSIAVTESMCVLCAYCLARQM